MAIIKIFFLYSSVYSCHHFLISSASVRSIPFLSFIVLIFAWNGPLVSVIFLKRSLVFTILLFSSISLRCSVRKAFLSLLAILWNSALRWVYLYFSPLPSTSLHFSAVCSLLEKCKLTLHWGITLHWSEWSSSKSLQTIHMGKCVEKREPSYTLAGNANWYKHYGEQYGELFKNGNKTTIWSKSHI